LGVIAVAGDQFKIKGPEGAPRPFAQISLESANDSVASNLLEELKDRIS